MARFTGILIHRNASVALLDVLDAWLAQTELERLIVVDNGSTAEHLEALRAGLERAGLERAGLESAGLERPGLESAGLERGRPPGDNGPLIELLEAGENLGFGPGANFGLRHWLASCNTDEDTEWVALAPHDAAPAVDCLERMGAALDARPGAALACADVGDGSIPVFDPYFGGMVTVPGPAATPADPDGWEDVDYPHGTLMVARRAALEEIGLFDERYFMYFEDADFCRRARDAGFQVWAVPQARMWHEVSVTAQRDWPLNRYHRALGQVRFYREHPHGQLGLLRQAYVAARVLYMALEDLRHGDWQLLGALWRGTRDGYSERRAVPGQR